MDRSPARLPEFGEIIDSGQMHIRDAFGNEGYCNYVHYEDGEGARTLIVSQIRDGIRVAHAALRIANEFVRQQRVAPARYLEHEIYPDRSYTYTLCVFDSELSGLYTRVRRSMIYDSTQDGTQPILARGG